MAKTKSLRDTLVTLNGSKVLGLRWHSSIDAYLGTVLEPGWLGSTTHAAPTAWDRDGKQLGTYKTDRPGYNLA